MRAGAVRRSLLAWGATRVDTVLRRGAQCGQSPRGGDICGFTDGRADATSGGRSTARFRRWRDLVGSPPHCEARGSMGRSHGRCLSRRAPRGDRMATMSVHQRSQLSRFVPNSGARAYPRRALIACTTTAYPIWPTPQCPGPLVPSPCHRVPLSSRRFDARLDTDGRCERVDGATQKSARKHSVRGKGEIRIATKRIRRIAASAGLGLTAALGASATAQGVDFTVNDRGDAGDGSCDSTPGDCTLRDALAAADNNNAGRPSIGSFSPPTSPVRSRSTAPSSRRSTNRSTSTVRGQTG